MVTRLATPENRVRRQQSGAATIEFAVVGSLFLTILLSIVEAGLLVTRMSLLDNATAQAARMVYTGAATGGKVTKDDIEAYICEQVQPFFSTCIDHINIELTPIDRLGDIPAEDAACRDSDVDIEPSVKYTPGASNTTIYMRACLVTDVVTPGLGLGLALTKTENNKFQLISAIAFQNEPF